MAAARMRPDRGVILTDPNHFPTNRYLAASAARLLGLELLPVPVGQLPNVLRRRGFEVAVVSYGAVDYRTGEPWDINGLSAAAHDVGAVTVWDLCHAAGAVTSPWTPTPSTSRWVRLFHGLRGHRAHRRGSRAGDTAGAGAPRQSGVPAPPGRVPADGGPRRPCVYREARFQVRDVAT